MEIWEWGNLVTWIGSGEGVVSEKQGVYAVWIGEWQRECEENEGGEEEMGLLYSGCLGLSFIWLQIVIEKKDGGVWEGKKKVFLKNLNFFFNEMVQELIFKK